MSYVDDSLIPNETVAYRTRLHWIIFGWPFVFVVAACVAFDLRLIRSGEVLLGLALILFIAKYLLYVASEFAVTNRRVIIKVGFLTRRTLELMLGKVEAIAVTQNLLGQLVGCGTITVTGTGGTRELFAHIRAPLQFRRAVQAASSAQESV
jgi:uncharacterized membrane protein YdbT with pleckstrin-like domain